LRLPPGGRLEDLAGDAVEFVGSVRDGPFDRDAVGDPATDQIQRVGERLVQAVGPPPDRDDWPLARDEDGAGTTAPASVAPATATPTPPANAGHRRSGTAGWSRPTGVGGNATGRFASSHPLAQASTTGNSRS